MEGTDVGEKESQVWNEVIILNGPSQWLSGKESTCKAGDMGWKPRSRRSPREGHNNPLQHSCLENSRDRGAWQATYSSWGCKESDTTEQLTLEGNMLYKGLYYN